MACARTVAVVVPSPATSEVLEATSRTICAPMFSSPSFNSISFATVTPSWVIVGDPNFFSRTTLRPLGPSVIFTTSAKRLTPRSRARRASSWYKSILGIPVSPLGSRLSLFPRHDGQHVALAKNQVFLVVLLELGAGVLGED